MTAAELIAFEKEVAASFEAGNIGGPVHLSGGNEELLIGIFMDVAREDWVLSTWRSHYHALLHGVPRDRVMDEIMAGRSMNLAFPDHRFLTSAIVGGCLPIAVGIAAALRRQDSKRKVWCFVGDMCATTGAFHETVQYAEGHHLPVTFVVEDNGLSTDSPTKECWGPPGALSHIQVERYEYERIYPHVNVGRRASSM